MVSTITKYSKCIFWSEENDCYIATCPELEGCISLGDTEEMALSNLNKSIEAWIDDQDKYDKEIPRERTFEDIEYDEDCPPLSHAALKQMHCQIKNAKRCLESYKTRLQCMQDYYECMLLTKEDSLHELYRKGFKKLDTEIQEMIDKYMKYLHEDMLDFGITQKEIELFIAQTGLISAFYACPEVNLHYSLPQQVTEIFDIVQNGYKNFNMKEEAQKINDLLEQYKVHCKDKWG